MTLVHPFISWFKIISLFVSYIKHLYGTCHRPGTIVCLQVLTRSNPKAILRKDCYYPYLTTRKLRHKAIKHPVKATEPISRVHTQSGSRDLIFINVHRICDLNIKLQNTKEGLEGCSYCWSNVEVIMKWDEVWLSETSDKYFAHLWNYKWLVQENVGSVGSTSWFKTCNNLPLLINCLSELTSLIKYGVYFFSSLST